MTQSVVFGSGAIRRLPRTLDGLGTHRVFLVTGRASFERSGAADALGPGLVRRVAGRFSDFSENPKLEDVVRGVDALRAASADVVVAVGGGSALDMAKLINGIAHQAVPALDIVQGRQTIRHRGLPLVAVPTTAGSGSEATHFAVVYVGHSKYSVASPLLLPIAVILDPELTFSLSPTLTAITGMDAFAQAVESYWSVHSTDASKAWARCAIALVLRYLPEAVHRPSTTARRGMCKAAHFAGRAIDVTRTTGPHAMSYPLTSYFGLPHGHAVGLTLGRWLLFNSHVTATDVADPRGVSYVRETIDEIVRMLGCLDAEQCCGRIEEFARDLGLQTRLGSLGVSQAEAVDVVVPNVNVERLSNNPRTLSRDSLRQLVEAVC